MRQPVYTYTQYSVQSIILMQFTDVSRHSDYVYSIHFVVLYSVCKTKLSGHLICCV